MGESRWQRTRFRKDGFQHAIDVATNFRVREAKNVEPVLLEESISPAVQDRIMSVAVNLDHQTDWRTKEIHDHRADDGLTPELQALQLGSSQPAPQRLFKVRGFLAHLAGKGA